jgi:GNAT superfamily N-acetyltransferase
MKMVVKPLRCKPFYKVRYWIPRPIAEGGNRLPAETMEKLKDAFHDANIFFAIRKVITGVVDCNRVRLDWPRDVVAWEELIRASRKQIYYITGEDREVVATGEVEVISGSAPSYSVRIYVREGHRGRGLGTAMLAAIEQNLIVNNKTPLLVFNEYNVEKLPDDARVKRWLIANNFEGEGRGWFREGNG